MNRTKNVTAGIVVIALIGLLIYTVIVISRPQAEQIQGIAEAQQVKVASKLTGRIDSLPIYKGMDVNRGDTLFTMGSPEIKAKMRQAMAGKAAAGAQEQKAVKGATTEDIEAAFNQYQKAKAAAELAKKTHKRIKNLYEDGVVSRQKLDEAETRMKTSERTAESAKALYLKAKKGSRPEDKRAAKAMTDKADAVVEEIRTYLNENTITAPVDGEIAEIIAEEQELIPSGFPVITLVNLDDIWVTLHLKETYLQNIQKGTHFKADIPALGREDIEFNVSYIHPLGDYATWRATKEKGEFDIKTFEIEARPVKPIEGFRPGMSVLINKKALITKTASK